MTDFSAPLLGQKLARLSKEKRLAFAILLCERMIPALTQFSSETGFGDAVYKTCLDNAWKQLAEGTGRFDYRDWAERCLNDAPDTEEFDHPLTSSALNAALSVAATMNFLADGNVDHIVNAARLAYDTAALYAQAIEATPPQSLSHEEVMEHLLVQRELRQQAIDLKFLESLRLGSTNS